MSAPRRQRARQAVDGIRTPRLHLVMIALATAVALLPSSGSAANADALGSATARASALRMRLNDLQSQADRAVEHYDLLQGQLGQQVSARVSLEQAVTRAEGVAGSRGAVRDRRVRSLYMRGGQAGLYASVLNSSSLDEALHQTTMVQYVLTGDRAAQRQATAATRRLGDAQAAARDAAVLTTRRSSQVAVAADQVQGLLQRQQGLISAADGQVRVLLRQQQDAVAAASAASFTTQLDAARAASPSTAHAGAQPIGPVGPVGPVVATPSAARGEQNPSAGPGTRVGPVLPLGSGKSDGVPAPNARIATVLAVAREQLGKPYVWGAVGPDTFDCSGFTGYAYAAAAIALPRTAAQQYLTGSHPSLGQLAPGDLLFWATNPADYTSIEHMAMYLGDGLMIAAPHTGDVVKIERVYADGYFGATRVDAGISGHVAGPQWADSGQVAGR